MQAPPITLAEWRKEEQAAEEVKKSAEDDIKSDEQWLEKVRRNVTQREKQVQENKQFVEEQTVRLRTAQRHIAELLRKPAMAYLRFKVPWRTKEYKEYLQGLESKQETSAAADKHPAHKKARQDAFEHTPQKQQQAIVISDDDSMESVSDVAAEVAGEESDDSMEEVPDDRAAQFVPAFSDGRWHSEVQTELEKLEKRQQVEKADKELLKKLPYQEVITLLQDMLTWCSKFPSARKFDFKSLQWEAEDEKFYVEFSDELRRMAQAVRDSLGLDQCSYVSGESCEAGFYRESDFRDSLCEASDHEGAGYQEDDLQEDSP